MTKMQHYELVLVVGFFKRLSQYLSIIKYLSNSYKIGLFMIPLDKKLELKHKNTQNIFVEKCIELGAEPIKSKTKVHANLVIFPQQPYKDIVFDIISTYLTYNRAVAMMSLAWGGVQNNIIKKLNIKRLMVIDNNFFNFVLPHRGGKNTYQGCEIIEVGLPYKKYPVFNNIKADYIFAIPTPWSFPHEKDKHLFLNTANILFSELEEKDVVIFKTHNATDFDYFSPKVIKIFASFFPKIFLGFFQLLMKLLLDIKFIKPNGLYEKFITAMLYKKILKRVISLEKITSYNEFALEAFLPSIKKGVIGGLSNTIWGALFFELPYYNCVDINIQNRKAKNRLYVKKPKGGQALELNLKYFYVPYCKGELKFNEKYFDIIADSTRKADLITEIKKELNS